MLIDTLGRVMWDFVNRYRIFYSDAARRRWEAEADNRGLNAERLAQEPSGVWEEVAPRLSDHSEHAREGPATYPTRL